MQIWMLQLSKEKYFVFQYVLFDFILCVYTQNEEIVKKYVICYSNNIHIYAHTANILLWNIAIFCH